MIWHCDVHFHWKRRLVQTAATPPGNMLLQKDGIFESLHSYIDAEQLDKTTMTANTDIEQLQYDVVRDLIGDLDE